MIPAEAIATAFEVAGFTGLLVLGTCGLSWLFVQYAKLMDRVLGETEG